MVHHAATLGAGVHRRTVGSRGAAVTRLTNVTGVRTRAAVQHATTTVRHLAAALHACLFTGARQANATNVGGTRSTAALAESAARAAVQARPAAVVDASAIQAELRARRRGTTLTGMASATVVGAAATVERAAATVGYGAAGPTQLLAGARHARSTLVVDAALPRQAAPAVDAATVTAGLDATAIGASALAFEGGRGRQTLTLVAREARAAASTIEQTAAAVRTLTALCSLGVARRRQTLAAKTRHGVARLTFVALVALQNPTATVRNVSTGTGVTLDRLTVTTLPRSPVANLPRLASAAVHVTPASVAQQAALEVRGRTNVHLGFTAIRPSSTDAARGARAALEDSATLVAHGPTLRRELITRTRAARCRVAALASRRAGPEVEARTAVTRGASLPRSGRPRIAGVKQVILAQVGSLARIATARPKANRHANDEGS